MNTETGHKLIRYLIKHKHWSPFEHISCTFEIKTSRAIAAQILRHRSFTFQEFSQRYAQATSLEKIEWRKQGKTNRQVGDESIELPAHLQVTVNNLQNLIKGTYDTLIEAGIAKESARMILPLNTSTTIYMTGSLRSWIHYLELRCAEGTQKEHRDIALDIKKCLEKEFPETFKALSELTINE
jgi:thymidylate synthase (FAD)